MKVEALTAKITNVRCKAQAVLESVTGVLSSFGEALKDYQWFANVVKTRSEVLTLAVAETGESVEKDLEAKLKSLGAGELRTLPVAKPSLIVCLLSINPASILLLETEAPR